MAKVACGNCNYHLRSVPGTAIKVLCGIDQKWRDASDRCGFWVKYTRMGDDPRMRLCKMKVAALEAEQAQIADHRFQAEQAELNRKANEKFTTEQAEKKRRFEIGKLVLSHLIAFGLGLFVMYLNQVS